MNHMDFRKHILCLAVFFLGHSAVCIKAQPVGGQWISCPDPDNVSQLFFRQSFTFDERPERARLSVATTGDVIVYINGRNISTDVFTVWQGFGNEAQVKSAQFDVARFLAEGRNVVAIWYAPHARIPDRRQLAVSLYGEYDEGDAFAFTTDDTWLCRYAPAGFTPDGCEYMDGEHTSPSWKTDETGISCWIPVCAVSGNVWSAFGKCSAQTERLRVVKVLSPDYFDVESDGITYDFGTACRGFVRVTLRGTMRGEHLSVPGLEYVCSGRPDEQAYNTFRMISCRRLFITGDEHFERSQIQKVELLVPELLTFPVFE